MSLGWANARAALVLLALSLAAVLILPGLFPRATHIVVGWAAINLSGLWFCIRNYISARADLRTLEQHHLDGDAREAARIAIRTEAVRSLELGAGALVAILVALPQSWINGGAVVLWLLFALPVGIAYNSLQAALYREEFTQAHKLREAAERKEQEL